MGVVVVLIIASFAFDFRGQAGGFATECALTVHDRCVPPREFNAAARLIIPANMQPKQQRALGMRRLVLDGLAERELLRMEAERLGVAVTEDAVDEELFHGRFHFSLPAERYPGNEMFTYVPVTNPKTEKFDFDVYMRMVRNFTRMSGKDFKQFQTEELIAARMRDLAQLPVRVSEDEAFATYEFERSRAVVRVADLNASWFSRFVTPLDEEAVTAYLKEHEAELTAAAPSSEGGLAPAPVPDPGAAPAEPAATLTEPAPAVAEAPAPGAEAPSPGAETPPAGEEPAPAPQAGCTLVSEIFFGYPPAADAADEAQIQQRAADVRKRALRPQRFEVLARAYSTAPSASYGGRRGCLDPNESEEAKVLHDSIASLAVGQVSEPLQVPGGVYLVKLEGRLEGDAAAEAQKRADARPLAARALADARLRRFAEALIAAAQGGQSLQDAVDALTRAALAEAKNPPELRKEIEEQALDSRERPRVSVSAGFSRADTINPAPGVVGDVAVKPLAFTLEPEAVHPEPLKTREGLAVLQLKEKTVAAREEFEKDKLEIIRELRASAQADALARFVQRLREENKDAIILNPRFLDSASEEVTDES